MVTAKLEALYAGCRPFSITLQLSWYLYIRLGEPEYVDFKENLFKALMLVTSGASVESNP